MIVEHEIALINQKLDLILEALSLKKDADNIVLKQKFQEAVGGLKFNDRKAIQKFVKENSEFLLEQN